MHLHIWLALLGLKMGVPYEREAMRAIRRYIGLICRVFAKRLCYCVLFAQVCMFPLAIFMSIDTLEAIWWGFILGGWIFVCFSLFLYGFAVFSSNRDATLWDSVAHEYEPELSAVAELLHRRTEVPRVAVHTYREGNFYAHIVNHDESSWRIYLTEITVCALNSMQSIGLLAHEIGHTILPMGNHLYSVATLPLAFTNRKILGIEYFLLKEAGVIPSTEGVKKNPLVTDLHRQLMAELHRLYPRSSFPLSQAREDAVDAIAVLMLGHTYPLIVLLEYIERLEMIPGCTRLLRTHRRARDRVSVLMDMEQSHRNTR